MGESILAQVKEHKKYEVIYIIRPNLDEEAVDKVVAGVEEYLKGQGGKVISSDKKGRRRLAYEVEKMRDGYYVVTLFTAPSQSIVAIKRMMSLSEEIIRSLVIVEPQEETAYVSQ